MVQIKKYIFKLKKIFEKNNYKKINFYILPSNKDQEVKFENLNLKDNFKILKITIRVYIPLQVNLI